MKRVSPAGARLLAVLYRAARTELAFPKHL
jgi:hypothetical protein